MADKSFSFRGVNEAGHDKEDNGAMQVQTNAPHTNVGDMPFTKVIALLFQ